MRVRFSNIVARGEFGCIFFGLLGACVLIRLSVSCCDSGAGLVPVASLSKVGMFERLRLVSCVFCG